MVDLRARHAIFTERDIRGKITPILAAMGSPWQGRNGTERGL